MTRPGLLTTSPWRLLYFLRAHIHIATPPDNKRTPITRKMLPTITKGLGESSSQKSSS